MQRTRTAGDEGSLGRIIIICRSTKKQGGLIVVVAAVP